MTPSPNLIAYYRDRCTSPLTQVTLAQALGVHVNTIQHWEKRGAPSPADLFRLTRLFVERGAIGDHETAARFWEISGREPFPELPELRRLFEDGEALADLERLSEDTLPCHAPLPPRSWMPLHRNPLFVGRVAELQTLAAALTTGDAAVVTGMGGIGKTQLACELVHRYGQFFPGGVFWLSFADPNIVPAEIAGCGGPGCMELCPNFGSLPLDDQVRLVLAAWQDPIPRLLIFDNCEDEELLARWRPTTGGCRVLSTSRRALWDAALGVRALPLGVLSRAESVALLRRQRDDLPNDSADLGAIAGELGDLPLALHLASSFLARYRHAITPADYLVQIRAANILQHPSLCGAGISPTGHQPHVTRTLMVSYERLDAANGVDALALALLARAACFAPDELIPRALLLATLEYAQGDLAEALRAEDALARLVELGLLEQTDAHDDAVLRMHCLLVAFIQARAIDHEARPAVERVVLVEARRRSEDRLPEPIIALQQHVRAIADAAMPRGDVRAADLCAELGWQLVLLSTYEEARPYLARALAIREAVLAYDHPDTAAALNRLGLLCDYQGHLAEAHRLYDRALAIWEQTRGPDHLDTAHGYNNLGHLLCYQGSYHDAFPYLQRALAVRRRLLGLRHADTARTLNNLGYLMFKVDRPAAARRYLKLTLAIREQILTPNHTATAQTLNELGEVLYAQGDYIGARRYHERALAMREAVLGVSHFHTAQSLKNLGMLLCDQGDFAGARAYLERALAICELALGRDHIESAWKCAALGDLLYAQGDEPGAQSYFERALAVYEAQLAAGHGDIERVRGRLAEIVRRSGESY